MVPVLDSTSFCSFQESDLFDVIYVFATKSEMDSSSNTFFGPARKSILFLQVKRGVINGNFLTKGDIPNCKVTIILVGSIR